MNVATGEVRYGKTMADVGGPYGRVQGRSMSANDWQTKIEGQSPEVAERIVEAYVVTDEEYPAEFVRNLAQELGTDERDDNVPKLLAENPSAFKKAINRTRNNPPATSPEPSEINWDTPRPPEYSGDIDVENTSAREIVESGAFEPQDKWKNDDRYSYDRGLMIDRKVSGMEALMDLGFGREAAVGIMDSAFDDSGARDRTNAEHVDVLEDHLKKWFGEDTANEFKKYLADPNRRQERYEQNDGVTELPEVPEELLRSMDDENLGRVARMYGLPSIRDAAPSPKSPEGPWPRGGKERKEFREQTIQKILEGVDHGYRFGSTRNNHKYGVYAPGGRRGDNRRPDDPHPHYVRTRLESVDDPDWDNRHPKKRNDPEVYYPEGMEPPKLAENAHPGSATTSQNENVVGEPTEKAEGKTDQKMSPHEAQVEKARRFIESNRKRR